MKLHIVTPPPRQGWAWIQQAFMVYMRQAWPFTALLMLFFFVFSLLSVTPVVGPFLTLMCMPLLTLVFMINTERVASNKPFEWSAIGAPIQAPKPIQKQLLILLVFYALAMILGLKLCDTFDNDRFTQLLTLIGNAKPTAEAQKEVENLLSDPMLTYGLMLRSSVIGIVAVPFWYAPTLVYWNQQSAAQAVFSSTFACWSTRKALAMNILAWSGLMVIISLLIGLVMPLLGLAGLISWIALPLGLVMTAVFYVSLYFMYKDTFASITNGDATGDTAS
jgi:hypothetical protein